MPLSQCVGGRRKLSLSPVTGIGQRDSTGIWMARVDFEREMDARTIGVNRMVRVIGRWSDGTRPIYRELADAIATSIRRGDIRPGTRLPAERSLARALAVSRTTVVNAYRRLAEMKVVIRRRGSGTYALATGTQVQMASEILATLESSEVRLGGSEATRSIVDLSSAAFEAPEEVLVSAAQKMVKGLGSISRSNGYTGPGLPILREQVAAYFSDRGVPTEPTEILITGGAQQANTLFGMLTLNPGDCALIEDPAWVGAIDVYRALHCRLESVPLDRDGIICDGLLDAIGRHNPSLLYLSPTVNNPTGVLMTEERRIHLAECLRVTNIAVVEDNTLCDLLQTGITAPRPICEFTEGNVVGTIGSLSKVFWGGLRVGWIRASRPIIERLLRLKIVADQGSSPIGQLVAAALMENLDHMSKLRVAQIDARLNVAAEMLTELMPGFSWNDPDGGLCLWIRMPGGSAREFAQVAMRHGVSVVPGSLFSAVGGQHDRIRLPLSASESQLQRGIELLAASWEMYARSLDYAPLTREAIV